MRATEAKSAADRLALKPIPNERYAAGLPSTVRSCAGSGGVDEVIDGLECQTTATASIAHSNLTPQA
jgi:hypothetical protein